MDYIEQGYSGENSEVHTGGKNSLQKISAIIKTRTAQHPPKVFKKPPTKNLSGNYLLAAQSDDFFIKLMPYFESVTLTGKEYVYQPGDRVDFVYFPESAVMSEFQILEDGRTVEIAMTGREGAIGMLAAFSSQAATNWTQALIAGNALRVKSSVLKQCASENLFQTLFLGYINEYVGQISQRAVCNSHHTVEERFCSWLLMIQNRLKTDKLPVTHEQVAKFLGVHRPSITHAAQDLRGKKAIDYMRGNLFIRCRQTLESLACRCYAEIDKNRRQNLFVNSMKKSAVM